MIRPILPLALAVLLAAPARAEPVSAEGWTAHEIVDRVTEALGGRDALERIGGYLTVSDAEGMGLHGTSTTWAVFPDRQRIELSLSPLTLLSVAAQGEAWLRDHNGHVVAYNDHQRADLRTGLYIDAFRPWLDPFDPSVIRLDGTEAVGAAECPVLVVQPPGGNEVRVAIDPGSFLPVRQSHVDESGLGRDVVEYGDYASVDGVQIPHLVRSYNDSLPANRAVYRLRQAELHAPSNTALFDPPATITDVTFPPGSTRIEGPLVYRNGHAFVAVHVIGRSAAVDALFLLDTGATLSLIDSELLAELNLEPTGDLQGLSVGGTMPIELVKVPFLRIGGILLEDQVLGTTPFARRMSEQLGVEAAGVLGFDFFSRFVVTLDFSGGRCVLQRADSGPPPAGGTTLPLQFVDQQPTVQGVLDGNFRGRWRLDTGADALAVHTPSAQAWGLHDRHPTIRELVTEGLHGATPVSVVRADAFQLGPYEVRRPLLLLPTDGEGVLAAGSIDGNLGTSILERFVITVDFGRSQIHLVPSPTFAREDRIRTVDFLIGWSGARVEVLAVESSGEGHARGLRAGQEVVRIGGRPAIQWTESELARLWAGETDTSVVVIVRDDAGRHRIAVDIPPAP